MGGAPPYLITLVVTLDGKGRNLVITLGGECLAQHDACAIRLEGGANLELCTPTHGHLGDG